MFLMLKSRLFDTIASGFRAMNPCLEVFIRCADAVHANKLISRESRQDKEFHFQNWFKARICLNGFEL